MITNVPLADELQTVSLRLYFTAWEELTKIISEFQEVLGAERIPEWSHQTNSYEQTTGSWLEEWEEYLSAAQSDFQGIYTLIQQSQEIGLKALICEVSPFLLLKRLEARASSDNSNTFDFSDFPTLDASELIRAHKICCTTTLSPQFIVQYDEIRRNRNKIYHLGIYRNALNPNLLIDLLLTQFKQLYPNRKWLPDRLHFASIHRWAGADYADWNERTGVLTELWRVLPLLTHLQFKTVMTRDISEGRLICPTCVHEAHLGEFELAPAEVPTAYLSGAGYIHCVLCDSDHPVRELQCKEDHCSGSLASAEQGFENMCLSCGNL